MSDRRGTESEFELATIARLEQLGYRYTPGIELDRPPDEVVLRRHLRNVLARQHPDLPDAAIELAVLHFIRPDGVDTLRRNMAFHQRLVRGYELPLELSPGHVTHRLVYAIDWEYPERNEFVVANQFPVRGRNDRRPDLVIFVNGLPLAVFELKNPYSEEPTVHGAWNQIQHYRNDIPQLFDYNAITVVSDGISTLQGMWPANEEWYAPWKSIDGISVEPATTASMKALLEGLFLPKRLLSYIRDFIVFQVMNDRITKKGAKYHQFFAVRLAARKTIITMTAGRERRLGVIWHTTGSGKSLSMIFLVGILRRRLELGNPTFVIEVDRNDLDDQLHDEFVAARSLVGPVEQAESVEDLRELLQTQGGEVVFTTIEKFRLREEELAHPVLSLRDNIIIIADEAHRSQYGFLQGYARYLAEALPNARRLGFTGTPISFSGEPPPALALPIDRLEARLPAVLPSLVNAAPPPEAGVSYETPRPGVFRRALHKIEGTGEVDSAAFVPPSPIRKVAPIKPADAGAETRPVDVKVFIDDSGNVSRALALTKGNRLATLAALSAARQWQFTPARKHDKPVPSEIVLHFR